MLYCICCIGVVSGIRVVCSVWYCTYLAESMLYCIGCSVGLGVMSSIVCSVWYCTGVVYSVVCSVVCSVVSSIVCGI